VVFVLDLPWAEGWVVAWSGFWEVGLVEVMIVVLVFVVCVGCGKKGVVGGHW